jgi:MFS family permease
VIALGTVSLLTDVSSEMIYPLLPVFLSTTLGAGPAALGLVEGVAETTASLLKLASGIASDRTGRRKPLVVAGYALSAVMRPLAGLATSWGHILAVRFSDRIGKGVRTSPRDALVAAYVPPGDRGRAFGLQRSMDHLGAVVGPVVAFLLLTFAGVSMRHVFLLAAIPGAAAVAVLVLAVKDASPPPPKERARLGSAIDLPPAFRKYLLVVVLFTLGNASDAFLVLRAVDAGVPKEYVPLLWGAFHVVKSSFSVPLGTLADRWERRKMVAAGWGVYAAAYFAWGLTGGLWWMTGLFLFYGLHHAATEGAERALVADLVPPDRRGSAFGWFHLAVGIGALPASLLFGLLYKLAGATAAFLASGSLALLAAIVLMSLPAEPFRRGAARTAATGRGGG